MGMDYLFKQANKEDDLGNRPIFFKNMSRARISIKKSCSSDKIIDENRKKILFKNDLSNQVINNSNSKDISNFLNSHESIKSKEDDLLNISSSSFSTRDDSRTSIDINQRNDILSLARRNKDLRKSYYQKLYVNNYMNSNKEAIKNNTLFIFDWDDTLFSTTHLNPSKENLFLYINPKEKKMMSTIEFYIKQILIKALSKGTVLIITNSSEGWVEACVNFYYPNLIPILSNVNIISSRQLYSDKYPGRPLMWKIKAFNDLRSKFNFEKCHITNIVSIGDDKSEIIAAQKLGEKINNCIVKTIKFREEPNLKELIKQLMLINDEILRIYKYPKSLTIQVDKKKNPKN
jgi:hypothetical protein